MVYHCPVLGTEYSVLVVHLSLAVVQEMEMGCSTVEE